MPIKAGTFDAVTQYLRNKLPQLGFFSTLDELIRAAPQEHMPAKQWQEYLKPGQTLTREGVQFPLKAEELQYSPIPNLDKIDPEGAKNLQELYASQLGHPVEFSPDSISKEALLQHLHEHRPEFNIDVRVQDQPNSNNPRVKPEYTAVSKAVTPGSSSLPRSVPQIHDASYPEYAHTPGVPDSYEENVTTTPFDFGTFPSHFSSKDLSWSRTTRHETPEGRLARLVEEIQSDRHEAAAEKQANLSDDLRKEVQDRTGFQYPEHLTLSELESRIKRLQEGPVGFRPYGSVPPGMYDDLISKLRDSIGRRGYRTPEEEDLIQSRDGLGPPDNYSLIHTPPDTPFKDPADYGLLELKKQLINSVNQGDSHLALIDPQSQIDRYGTEAGRDAGMRHVYGNVYPSALKKLARQYGAEVTDLPLDMTTESKDLRPPTLQQLGYDTPFDMVHDTPHSQLRGRLSSLLNDYRDIWDLDEDTSDAVRRIKGHLNTLASRALNLGDHGDLLDALDTLDQRYGYGVDNGLLHNANPPIVNRKTFPALNITPEVAEKVKKAGVPLFTVAGAGAVDSENNGDNSSVDQKTSFGEGGPVFFSRIAKALHLRGRLDSALEALKTYQGKVEPQTAEKLNQGYLAGIAAHHEAIDTPSLDNLSALQQRVKEFENLAKLSTPDSLTGADEVPAMASGGSANPYAEQLTEIANESPGRESGAGIDYLVNAAMMRLGMMPPAYALYNPPPSFAEGGSLASIAEGAREFGGPEHAGDRARIVTRIAQQLYGVDKDGNPVFLGGVLHKGATPPGIVDQALAIPHSFAQLGSLAAKIDPTPGIRDVLIKADPQWSKSAAGRLAELDRAVARSTGVGEPDSISGIAEDMISPIGSVAMLGRLAREGSIARKLAGHFAGFQGGADPTEDPAAKLAAIKQRLAATPDPSIEDAAMQQTNSGE